MQLLILAFFKTLFGSNLIGSYNSFFDPFLIIVKSEHLHVPPYNLRQRQRQRFEIKAWCYQFDRYYHEFKVQIYIANRKMTIVAKRLATIPHWKYTKVIINFNVSVNCIICHDNRATCTIYPCGDLVCLNCAYDHAPYTRCVYCLQRIQSITHFTPDRNFQLKKWTIKQLSYSKLLKSFMKCVTNHFTKAWEVGSINLYYITMQLQESYELRCRSQHIRATTSWNHLGDHFQNLSVMLFRKNVRVTFKIRNLNQVNWKVKKNVRNDEMKKFEKCCLCLNVKLLDCLLIPCHHSICCKCVKKMIEYLRNDCSECRTVIFEIHHLK